MENIVSFLLAWQTFLFADNQEEMNVVQDLLFIYGRSYNCCSIDQLYGVLQSFNGPPQDNSDAYWIGANMTKICKVICTQRKRKSGEMLWFLYCRQAGTLPCGLKARCYEEPDPPVPSTEAWLILTSSLCMEQASVSSCYRIKDIGFFHL